MKKKSNMLESYPHPVDNYHNSLIITIKKIYTLLTQPKRTQGEENSCETSVWLSRLF